MATLFDTHWSTVYDSDPQQFRGGSKSTITMTVAEFKQHLADAHLDGQKSHYASSYKTLAEFMQMAPVTVEKAKWVPEKSEYGYDLSEAVKRRVSAIASNNNTGDGTDDRDKTMYKLQLRKTEADAVAKELANEERRGNLISKNDVLLQWSGLQVHIRNSFMALPDELARMVDADQQAFVKQKVERRIFETLAKVRETAKSPLEDFILEEAERIHKERGDKSPKCGPKRKCKPKRSCKKKARCRKKKSRHPEDRES